MKYIYLLLLIPVVLTIIFLNIGETGDGVELVIFLFLDTVRADHLGCYGYSRNTSPTIDLISEKSFVFENAYSQAPFTEPSTASLLTSANVKKHKIFGAMFNLSDDFITITEVLKSNGFTTSLFTESYTITRNNMQQGFDFIEHYDKNEININDVKERLGAGGKQFILIHLQAAHEPYLCGEPYDSMFNPSYDGEIPSKEKALEYLEKYPNIVTFRDLILATADGFSVEEILSDPAGFVRYDLNQSQEKRKLKDHDHLVALYDGKIRRTDDSINEIYNEMNSLKITNKTIMVIFSDHGEGFFEHGEYDHGKKLFEEFVHVPLIILTPDSKGERIRSIVSLIDVFPTVLDMLDIKPSPKLKKQMDGISLVDIIQNRTTHREIFSHGAYIRSIRTSDGFLYIYNLLNGFDELYILPDDHNNVAEEYPEKTAELKKKIFEYLGYY